MNLPSILLVGCGPHAERIYLPALKELEQKQQLKLTCVLEVPDKIVGTKIAIDKHELSADIVNVMRSDKGELDDSLRVFLNELQEKYKFDGVIVATEPTQHKQYILWALEQNLHILVDKPITTYDNVSNDVALAKQINDDFRLFLKNYKDRSKAFIVNAQRRYHKGFLFVQDNINEIAKRFQMPVTSISSMHSDGQWRFPDEIVTQNYHPYNSGYGKVSHSGYHIVDMVSQFIKSGSVPGKEADEHEYYSKFIRPDGILKQLSPDEYHSIFNNRHAELADKFSSVDLSNLGSYGEVDAHASITAKLHGVNIAHYGITLMHNTFSRRDWVEPGSDLYKGNGRVKHEYHNIVQGPFQTIQVHSYQANDKHHASTADDYEFGGNNHFDICIFRNSALTGDKEPYKCISIKDLDTYDETRLVTELTKKTVVYELSDIINGVKSPEDSYSYFPTHAESVRMMSMFYSPAHQRGNNISTYRYDS